MSWREAARRLVAAGVLACAGGQTCLAEAPSSMPWTDTALPAEARAQALLESMTQDEKLTLVFGYYSSDAPWKQFVKPAEGRPQSAGYVPGVARLGIPPQWEADAGIGVASQAGEQVTPATALPSNLAIAASWDPALAFDGGAMIGREARLHGFNVLLAGGINLNRDPRNGRTFEYAGDDPLLSALMVGAQIRGVQSNHIIATLKHYAFNSQETGRNHLSALIDEKAARQSDLLAFELAIENAQPGALMCAYNRLNAVYSCEHPWLLDTVLKSQWGYRGYVMSDWGGTHSTVAAAMAGLDQQSGYPFDVSPYFEGALKEAVANGHVPPTRLDDMARRILWALFSTGLFDHPVQPAPAQIDFVAHGRQSQHTAEGGMVLLKNTDEVLPLSADSGAVAVIGVHADIGVLSGGGSSQVYGPDGAAWLDREAAYGPPVYHRASPVQALERRLPKVRYASMRDKQAALRLARDSERVIVFAEQWSAEGMDGDLRLDAEQDALISALAAVHSHVIVVLQSGGPVQMPWLDEVEAVLAAWFPGSQGGEAIARVLTGEVNPSGRLPLTFPQSVEQLPRPQIPGADAEKGTRFDVDYRIEGAAVGYKWFDREKWQPLFPFGYGLSYTRFSYRDLQARVDGDRVWVSFTLRNDGPREGAEVAQIYAAAPTEAGWEAPQRLVAFRKQTLAAGESVEVALEIEPRLLAVWDTTAQQWVMSEGNYEFRLARDARTPLLRVSVPLPAQALASHRLTRGE